MLVSVLVPVYNRQRFIRAALTSLQLQTHADLEILVQDDGSTDATSAIVKEMAERDARIRFEQWTPNKGEAAARNRLIERAQGVFIAFLDSDDVAEPTKISLQASFLVDNPNVSAVGTACVIVDAEGNRRLRVVTLPAPARDAGVHAELLPCIAHVSSRVPAQRSTLADVVRQRLGRRPCPPRE